MFHRKLHFLKVWGCAFFVCFDLLWVFCLIVKAQMKEICLEESVYSDTDTESGCTKCISVIH